MYRDFKIGLAVGAVSVTAALVWLSTLPKLSTEARALQSAPSRPVESTKVYRADDRMPASSQNRQTTQIEQTVRIHVVEKGDTLSGISARYYGSSDQWSKIFSANKTTLTDPDRLVPGTRLLIPE